MAPESSTKGWRRTLVPITAIAAILALVTTVTAFAVSSNSSSTEASADETSDSTSFAITLVDISIQPSVLQIPKGKAVTLNVSNDGAMRHDLVLNNGVKSKMLMPGDKQTIKVPATDKDLDGWCTVAGHKAQGMTIRLVVGDASASDSHDRHKTSDTAAIDFNAKPADGWNARNPELPPATSGREHRITLHASEKVMEVAPGVRQQLWTFEDQVPGPALRGKVGDTFIITVVNDGKMPHSMDFHAGKASPDKVMRNLQPGESLEYRFKANYAGVYMYHCGTTPILHHIGNGMYGAIVIDPTDLAPVDKEYLFVQSEFYLGPQDEPGDITKMMNKSPDAVSFNGYVNQYKFAPIQVDAGKRIRTWVLDAGPALDTSFHIVGTVFDTTYQEGSYTLRPASNGGAQALGLQVAEGGFTEFSFDEDGNYPFVNHVFADATKGAAGSFRVGNPSSHGMNH